MQETNVNQINNDQLTASSDVFDYCLAVLKGTASGIENLIVGTLDILDKPITNGVYPIALVAYDATVIIASHLGAAHTVEGELGANAAQLDVILNSATANSEIYKNSLNRIQARINNASYIIETFNKIDGPQRVEPLTETAVTILAPGQIARSVKAARNMSELGVAYAPKFESLENVNTATIFEGIVPLTLRDVRNIRNEQSGYFLYVIDEDRNLLIGNNRFNLPLQERIIDGEILTYSYFETFSHADLANFKRVYAAGEVGIYNGEITSINNMSGHYIPQFSKLKDLQQHIFSKEGYTEVFNPEICHIENFYDPSFNYGNIVHDWPALAGTALGAHILASNLPTALVPARIPLSSTNNEPTIRSAVVSPPAPASTSTHLSFGEALAQAVRQVHSITPVPIPISAPLIIQAMLLANAARFALAPAAPASLSLGEAFVQAMERARSGTLASTPEAAPAPLISGEALALAQAMRRVHSVIPASTPAPLAQSPAVTPQNFTSLSNNESSHRNMSSRDEGVPSNFVGMGGITGTLANGQTFGERFPLCRGSDSSVSNSNCYNDNSYSGNSGGGGGGSSVSDSNGNSITTSSGGSVTFGGW